MQIGDGTCWEVITGLSQATGWETIIGFEQVDCGLYGFGGGTNSSTDYNSGSYTGGFEGSGGFGGAGGTGGGYTGDTSNGTGGTIGGASGAGSNNIFINDVPVISLEQTQIKNFMNSLTDEQHDFLYPDVDLNNLLENDNSTADSVIEYLNENDFSEESQEFIVWGINYLINNPTITFSQFQNWMTITPVGIENIEEHNTSYWENPSLTFPIQELPTFDDFITAYPSSTINAESLCTQIGGQILTLYNNIIASGKTMNTCAIRLSFALNYSGITIPNVAGTKQGSDGKNYFTFASDMNKWMCKTFGTNPANPPAPLNLNHYRYTKEEILNNPNLLAGKKGIFSMVSSNPSWSSGHCDLLFDDMTCLNNCHLDGPILYIDIWVLE